MQATVEHQLQQGKTVLILFWNPSGADDVAVHREIPVVQHALGAKIAVNYASAEPGRLATARSPTPSRSPRRRRY